MHPYPIDKKLVVAVASSALFNLEESDHIFVRQGEAAYRKYQEEHKNNPLGKGVAFPFVRRFLNFNKLFLDLLPVEVVLLSRNNPDTGLRVFNSIAYHGLDITRAAFMSGKPAFQYLPAFNASLFLSANQSDVRVAVDAGFPAGIVLQSEAADDTEDCELRIAFDFDGILADDESECINKEQGLEAFKNYEVSKAGIPHALGLLHDLFRKLGFLQQLELQVIRGNPEYKRYLRTAIVTARSAPTHERVVTTLKSWGVLPDETIFLGGISKKRVLDILKPHIFFDDQMIHLKESARYVPSVHVPFGKLNDLRVGGAARREGPVRPDPNL